MNVRFLNTGYFDNNIFVELTQTCTTRQECVLSDGSYAYCSYGHCECPMNHHPAGDLVRCVQSVNLDDACETNENCNYTSAGCYNNICKCIPDFVKINRRTCLKGTYFTFVRGCHHSTDHHLLLVHIFLSSFATLNALKSIVYCLFENERYTFVRHIHNIT